MTTLKIVCILLIVTLASCATKPQQPPEDAQILPIGH